LLLCFLENEIIPIDIHILNNFIIISLIFLILSYISWFGRCFFKSMWTWLVHQHEIIRESSNRSIHVMKTEKLWWINTSINNSCFVKIIVNTSLNLDCIFLNSPNLRPIEQLNWLARWGCDTKVTEVTSRFKVISKMSQTRNGSTAHRTMPRYFSIRNIVIIAVVFQCSSIAWHDIGDFARRVQRKISSIETQV